MNLEQTKNLLNAMPLAGALWWFIENVDTDHADRSELFFLLRERVRNQKVPTNLIARLSVIYKRTPDITLRETLREAIRCIDPTDEKGLTLPQLEEKYSLEGTWHDGWNDHPNHPREEWRSEVADDLTQCGYWEWVFNKIQSGDE